MRASSAATVPDGSLRAPQARRDKAGKGRMTTDWLDARPAPHSPASRSQRRLPAWSAATGRGESEFSFDGRRFLRRTLKGDLRPARRAPCPRAAGATAAAATAPSAAGTEGERPPLLAFLGTRGILRRNDEELHAGFTASPRPRIGRRFGSPGLLPLGVATPEARHGRTTPHLHPGRTSALCVRPPPASRLPSCAVGLCPPAPVLRDAPYADSRRARDAGEPRADVPARCFSICRVRLQGGSTCLGERAGRRTCLRASSSPTTANCSPAASPDC